MDKEQLFSIGEVARLFHMSVSSLRHYESLGLLSPEYINPDSGYRYYSTRQFEVLNTLRYLRALDMPLPEIADFLQNRDVETIEQKLRQQKNRCRTKALGAFAHRAENRPPAFAAAGCKKRASGRD